MPPPIFPRFSVRDLSDVSSSDSAEENSSISGISLAKGFSFFFENAEIPEKRKITGDHPCSLKAFARTGANEEPSSVIKQRGFSGSSAYNTSGGSSETALAKPRGT